jgi:outer membrane lipoprotein carrier protein
MRAHRFVTAVAAVVAAVAVSLAPAPVRAGAIEQLREFAKTTQSARGDFTQQLLRPGARDEVSRGVFAFARPGKFRWEVRAPYEQLIVTDGQRLYFYDADLRQVTVREVGEAISATPAAILFGTADIDASFRLAELGARDGIEWLEAIPQNAEAGFERIAIGFKDGVPQAMEVRDAFGQTTRFGFSSIERNPALDSELFRFTPPRGVDVVR